MSMHDYWRGLNAGQRTGLVAGMAMIGITTAALAVWALRDPWVVVASAMPMERQIAWAAELERTKIPFRIGDDGVTVLVPSSVAGRAQASMAGGSMGVPPAAGLEIFKETDFSTTDFAQRVNYQRALQGELSRTLQSVAGVQSARVHVVLPESGLLRRQEAKASVAITLQLAPGKTLSPAQVMGIQRLAAASVPEIKPGDVVVLDGSGRTLSRGGGDAQDDATSAQLDLKRQVDAYVEGKLTRLLTELVPDGQVTLSADTLLDFKQLKVTTEEPVAASGKDAEHPTGVVMKERQSQRSGGVATGSVANGGSEASDWEYEYKVGHRVEQSLSVPGAVKRMSVAVVLHGAPETLVPTTVEQIVAHAVGLDRARGDSVAVVLLPQSPRPVAQILTETARPAPPAEVSLPRDTVFQRFALPVLSGMVVILLGCIGWLLRKRSSSERPTPPVDIDAATAKVRAWLKQEEVMR